MNPYPRHTTMLLLQVLFIIVLSQCSCSGFQATTKSSRNNNCQRPKNTLKRRLVLPKTCTAMTRIKSVQDDDDSESHEHTITVHYENRSCEILVRSDETILAALERNQLTLENLGLTIPSDCRRGNCLTCTGTHAAVSSDKAIVCDGDGLSPHISRTIQDKGYVLTCSTRVVGEGLQLNLGENQKVWRDIYQNRLEREPTQDEKWAAMARNKRQTDERNKGQWEKQMEDLVQSDGGSA